MQKGCDLYPSEYNFKYFTRLQSACSYQGKLQTNYVVLTFYDFKHHVIAAERQRGSTLFLTPPANRLATCATYIFENLDLCHSVGRSVRMSLFRGGSC